MKEKIIVRNKVASGFWDGREGGRGKTGDMGKQRQGELRRGGEKGEWNDGQD